MKHISYNITGQDIPIGAFVDSCTTFNCVAKDGKTMEKRIQIDVNALRESRDRSELRTLGWIPGKLNPTDGVTKNEIPNRNSPLLSLMKQNKIHIHIDGWKQMPEKSLSVKDI